MSLLNRLITVASRKGEKVAQAVAGLAEYNQLIKHVSLLDALSWPAD